MSLVSYLYYGDYYNYCHVNIVHTVWRISCPKNTANWKALKRKYFKYVGFVYYWTVISMLKTFMLALLCSIAGWWPASVLAGTYYAACMELCSLLHFFENYTFLSKTKLLMLPYTFFCNFCCAMLCKRGLCYHAVSVCPSVCLSLCLSHSWTLSKQIYLQKFFAVGEPQHSSFSTPNVMVWNIPIVQQGMHVGYAKFAISASMWLHHVLWTIRPPTWRQVQYT